MNEKAAVPALDTPLSAPSGPGGQHWQARTLSNDPKRDNIDPDRLFIRWMSDSTIVYCHFLKVGKN